MAVEATQTPSVTTPYELLGGEDGVRRLINRFYDIMNEAHEVHGIRQMHAQDLGPMKEKLFEFMSGWLGGPALYLERHGSICITKAHTPFTIGERERDQWLLCMERALADTGASDTVREMMKQPLYRIADFLRNQ